MGKYRKDLEGLAKAWTSCPVILAQNTQGPSLREDLCRIKDFTVSVFIHLLSEFHASCKNKYEVQQLGHRNKYCQVGEVSLKKNGKKWSMRESNIDIARRILSDVHNIPNRKKVRSCPFGVAEGYVAVWRGHWCRTINFIQTLRGCFLPKPPNTVNVSMMHVEERI